MAHQLGLRLSLELQGSEETHRGFFVQRLLGDCQRRGGPARKALGVTKQALDGEAALDLEAALAYEAEVQAQLMTQPNFRESYEAFKAKRETKFA